VKRPKKQPNLLAQVHVCILEGCFKDTSHAIVRKRERKISLPDILYVLKTGFHEKQKDSYQDKFKAWNYAIRGKTIDDREIRVIVSFDLNGMLIITAILLTSRPKK
jgi:hypothetical protein